LPALFGLQTISFGFTTPHTPHPASQAVAY
jgi:hypothetical protein